jgi:Ribonuclease G/E
MNNTLILDAAPGETRAGLFDQDGTALALYVDRASDAASFARNGALYCGRVRAVEPSLNAAFVDLGIGQPGFLPLGKARGHDKIFEGAAIIVRIRREAFAEKGPLLMLDTASGDDAKRPCPSLVSPAPDFVQRINAKEANVREATREDRETLDDVFEAALSPLVRLPGGGEVTIEPTRALVAVDVDTASDTRRALEVNNEAIVMVFRHLAMRGLAGIVAIDFAPMKGAKERKKLNTALTQAVGAQHGRMEAEPLNRFGVAVLTLQRRHRPIAEIMLGKNGAPSTETQALSALRRVENEHRAQPAKAITLQASPTIIQWLDTHKDLWAEPLLSRLGGRLTLTSKAEFTPDQFEVIAQ